MAVVRRLRRAPRPEDEGFTLIELLVVVLIIGILAAIAIPVYLNQRAKAVDAGARQDLRVLATFEETYLTSTAQYADFAQLDADGEVMMPTKGDTMTIVLYSSQSYCLSAKGAGSPSTWYYDSQAGGIQPAGSPGCPITTTGNVGASRTG
jgi:prepilin-type N-terminal cleavage/methylation domain-containing protein